MSALVLVHGGVDQAGRLSATAQRQGGAWAARFVKAAPASEAADAARAAAAAEAAIGAEAARGAGVAKAPRTAAARAVLGAPFAPGGPAPQAASTGLRRLDEHPDGTATSADRVRLTARGRGVVVMLAIVGGIVLGFVGGRADAASIPVPAETVGVVVERGDTLWSFAASVAEPGEDLRDVVRTIQRLNGMGSAALVAGQVIQLPAS